MNNMTSNFTISDELKDDWRARLRTRSLEHSDFTPEFASQGRSDTVQATPKIASTIPIPIWLEHIWRARLRTKSLGHGDFARELASQEDYGRVQAANILQDKFIADIISKSRSLPVKIHTTGISGAAFIRSFANGAHPAAPEQKPPCEVALQSVQEGEITQDVDLAIRDVPVHTSKYTAEECAQRKALKEERRVQQKRQKELQSSALPVQEEAGVPWETLEETPSLLPTHSAAKKRSKLVRGSPLTTKRSRELTEQTVAPITDGGNAPLTLTRSNLALYDDDDDLVGEEFLVLWPTFVGYLVVILCLILWAIIGKLGAVQGACSGEANPGSGRDSHDIALPAESGSCWHSARNGLDYQNTTMSLSTYRILEAADGVFMKYSVTSRLSSVENATF
jgi:hypothetical protein